MEEWKMLTADCVVISCCCQCLILQIIVFVFLKLPYKLVQKTKAFAKKKLRRGKREEKITIEREKYRYNDEFVGIRRGSVTIQVDGFPINGCGCCMEEVEKVLEGLSQKGEFAFGSFWGRDESGSYPTCGARQEFDNNVVQYHFIEMIGSFNCS